MFQKVSTTFLYIYLGYLLQAFYIMKRMCYTALILKNQHVVFTQIVVLEQISKYPANEALKIP